MEQSVPTHSHILQPSTVQALETSQKGLAVLCRLHTEQTKEWFLGYRGLESRAPLITSSVVTRERLPPAARTIPQGNVLPQLLPGQLCGGRRLGLLSGRPNHGTIRPLAHPKPKAKFTGEAVTKSAAGFPRGPLWISHRLGCKKKSVRTEKWLRWQKCCFSPPFPQEKEEKNETKGNRKKEKKKKICEKKLFQKQQLGLPWWRSGWESACQ